MDNNNNIYDKLSEERKSLQAQGLVPDWVTTAGWQLFSQKYLSHTDRAMRGQFERIARTAADYLPESIREEAYTNFFEILWKGWLSAATPVLSNTGTNKGFSVSCSGNVVGDSINDFYRAYHEVAMLTKMGFGTSSYLGGIRPRGAPISVGGKADGPATVFDNMVDVSKDVSQGNNRRGAWAGYIEIDHPTFDEIVDKVKEDPDGRNLGLNISNAFIEKLKAQDPEAIRRFKKAMKLRVESGRGYFFFTDKANAARPQMYKDLGLNVVASQLCVAPETLVLTDHGHVPIIDMVDQRVNVWNGTEFSEVEIKKTGENQELVEVVTDSGPSLTCTPYHKFYVRGAHFHQIVEKRAAELLPGDKLIKRDLPTIEGEEKLDKAYENGFYSGDGCLVGSRARVYLYGEKQSLLPLFKGISVLTDQPEQGRKYFYVDGLKDKFFVPDASYDIQSRVDWFAGWVDADGVICENEGCQTLQAGSIELEFLKEIQLMLQTLGVSSKIKTMRLEGEYQLPKNDGSGETGAYKCKTVYRLLITGKGLFKLHQLGFKTHRLVWVPKATLRNVERYVTISEVKTLDRKSDTYCFTEPKRHLGVFNGILTGQCSEISLHSSPEYTYSCVLSSMNLSKWDEWKNTKAVYWATVFLDCICEDFLTKARGTPGFEKIIAFTEKSRALGLGACGFHTYLMDHMMPFESFEAHMWNNEVFKHIHDESLLASQWMAKELGEPEWCKGYGVRNTHRTAIAPTKSTAVIMGGISEGINPDPAMVMTQTTAGGEVARIIPSLLKIMKERGKYSKKTIKDINDHYGSVQQVDWLTDEEKAVFRTAFEINQEAVIRLASQRQRFICQAQSLNTFFSADEDEEWISHIHKLAMEDERILSMYYVTTMAGVSGSKGECEACQ